MSFFLARRRCRCYQSRPALLLALMLWAGCGSVSAPREVVERFIEGDPAATFDPDAIFANRQTHVWSFTDEAAVSAWRTTGIASIDINERRGVLVPEGDPQVRPLLTLERDVAFEASEVHAVVVERRGRWYQAAVSWAGPGEAFSPHRRVEAQRDRTTRNSFAFPVGNHPDWRGTIERLRFEVNPRRDEPVRLVAITGVVREPDDEALALALTQPWKVDLGSDLRNAMLAAPGVPITRTLDLGGDHRLRFAYGAPSGTDRPVTFRVRVRPAPADDAVADSGAADAAESLWARTLDPAHRRSLGRWHYAEVDLDDWAGRAVEVRLETETDLLLDAGKGLPAWAHPQVVGPTTEDRRPNVVFISLDTLRADRLSSYGYPKPTSPLIDAWARDAGVRFANAVAQAPWTLPSHASMLSGLDAQRHGANHSTPVSPGLELLPEILHREGYHTAAFTGGGYLHPYFGFQQGFDVFRYWPSRIGKHELFDGMARTVHWLERVDDQPFFLFFHTYEPHFPHRRRMPFMMKLDGLDAFRRPDVSYEMRDRGFKSLQWGGNYMVVQRAGEEVPHEGLDAQDWTLISDMYDSAVAYTDAQIGRLLDKIASLGLSRDTLVIITSDHGEALGEDGLVGHNYLAEHNLMVPLFIGFPDRRGRGQAIEHQVRSIDIVPTVLDYLGLERPGRIDGVSLLPLIAGDASDHPDEAWSYASSANEGLALRIKNRLKYRYNNSAWSDLNDNASLHDLRRDPAEKVDISDGHPQADDLRRKVRLRLNGTHTGLRLEVRNHTRGLLRGRVKGDWLQHARIKLGVPSCRCLVWKPGAVFRVPPERGMSLQIEGPAGGETRLIGSLTMPNGRVHDFDHVFDLADVRRTWTYGFDGRAWRPMQYSGRAKVRFTFNRVGYQRTEPEAVAPRNRELEQQLRALGYVN